MDNLDIFNIVVTIFFVVAAFWLAKMLMQMKKRVIIYGRTFSASRILFAAAGVFSLFSLIAYHEISDIVRTLLIALVVLMYVLLRDGLCEDGFFVTGSFYPFTEVEEWDIATVKNKTTVYYGHIDPKEKSKGRKSVYYGSLVFDAKKGPNIEKVLKAKIGKKYKRIKKDK